MNKLYVGNLPYSVDDAQLESLFSEFGTITSATVISFRDTGKSKGFGFVEFESEEEAQAALAGMDGKEVDGRPLKVSEARPQKESM